MLYDSHDNRLMYVRPLVSASLGFMMRRSLASETLTVYCEGSYTGRPSRRLESTVTLHKHALQDHIRNVRFIRQEHLVFYKVNVLRNRHRYVRNTKRRHHLTVC